MIILYADKGCYLFCFVYIFSYYWTNRSYIFNLVGGYTSLLKMSLSGKYAVVTGGIGGIGIVICKELIANGITVIYQIYI